MIPRCYVENQICDDAALTLLNDLNRFCPSLLSLGLSCALLALVFNRQSDICQWSASNDPVLQGEQMPIAEGVASEVYSLVVAGDLVKSINDPQLMHELLLSFCRGSKSLDNDLSTMDIFLRENEEDNGDMIDDD